MCIMWVSSAWWQLAEGRKWGDILAMVLGCEAVGVAHSPQSQAGGEGEMRPHRRPASEQWGSQLAWKAEVRESQERQCPDAQSQKLLVVGVVYFPRTGCVLDGHHQASGPFQKK